MSETAVAKIDLLSALPRRSGFSPLPLAFPNRELNEPQDQADAYSQGFDEGHRVACESFAVDRQRLLALVENAQALQPEASDELAALLAETIYRLVCEIAGGIAVDRNLLDTRIAQALTVVADCDAARTLAVHPDDLALLDDAYLPLELVADFDMPRGDLRIGCSSGWIEHGTSIYVEALRNELGVAGDKP